MSAPALRPADQVTDTGLRLWRTLRLSLVMWASAVLLASSSSKKPETNTSFFPESNEVQGWTRSGETRTFPADRLWEYIDGDAERYIQAGVQRTLTTDYRYKEKIEAVADVYEMSVPGGAQRVFDQETANQSQAVEIGDAARLYGNALSFRRGRYFVRLIAYEGSPEVGGALVALGRSIEARLPD